MNAHPIPRNFIISPIVLWVLFIGGFVFSAVAAFTKILHLEIAGVLMPVGLMIQFPAWLIVMIDIISQRLKHKSMWLIGMFFIPWLAILLYLIQREKLIRMASR